MKTTNKKLTKAAALIAAFCLGAHLIALGQGGPAVSPAAAQPAQPSRVAQSSGAPAAQAPSTAEPAISEVAEPADFRLDHYREPVPKTLAGAKVIATVDAENLHAGGNVVFIDVYPRAPKPPNLPAGTLWRDPPHLTVPGAVWMPNVGYGVLPPETEAAFKAQLEKVSGGDKAKTIVFFCLRNCWMSWNAGKRAVSYGYTAINWFPDGNDGWQEAGNELEGVQPLP